MLQQELAATALSDPNDSHSAVRVAAVKFDPQVGLENLEANRKAVHNLEQAASAGADLIVLPELAMTAYTFKSRGEAYAHAQQVPNGRTVQEWSSFFGQLTRELIGQARMNSAG